MATLREVVEHLAAIERAPCSPGEREAAHWLAARLRAAGGEQVELEDAPSWGSFQPLGTALGALGLTAAGLALSRRSRPAVACALAAAAGLVDEAQNGPRWLRRAVRRRRATLNVVARCGPADARRTLVVLAHHDAAKTGRFFDQSLVKALHRRWPRRLERARTQAPQWWLGLAAPAGALASVLLRRRGPAIAGGCAGVLATGAVLDMWRSPTVPGANDNLSAVAAIVALAEMLRARRPAGLRVLLVSCGAEETLQDGIRAFVARHREDLPRGRTWFLNLDTVGSPRLVMVEGDGPIWMEDYADPAFRDLLAEVAQAHGVSLLRGFRARASTDTVIPSRAGHPSALLGSITAWMLPANYHLMSDVPENLDYGTVAEATRLAYAVAERLASSDRFG